MRVCTRVSFIIFLAVLSLFMLIPLVCSAAEVMLAWDSNLEPEVVGYRVYYDTSSYSYSFYYPVIIDAGNQTSVTITGLSPSITYYFTVTAYTAGGDESWYSDEILYTTPGSSASPSSTSGGGGCFIATAAYGSYLAPEVMTLREFRDSYLMTNSIGNSFVAWYYRVSPPAADLIASNESLRCVVRLGLTPIVYAVNYPMAAFLIVAAIPLAVITRKRRADSRH